MLSLFQSRLTQSCILEYRIRILLEAEREEGDLNYIWNGIGSTRNPKNTHTPNQSSKRIPKLHLVHACHPAIPTHLPCPKNPTSGVFSLMGLNARGKNTNFVRLVKSDVTLSYTSGERHEPLTVTVFVSCFYPMRTCWTDLRLTLRIYCTVTSRRQEIVWGGGCLWDCRNVAGWGNPNPLILRKGRIPFIHSLIECSCLEYNSIVRSTSRKTHVWR